MSSRNGRFRIWMFAAIAVAIVAAAAAIPLLTSISPRADDWGPLGDYAGGVVGTAFALLSFLALIYMIYLQRKELSLQREELSHARQDTESQRRQLEAQNETLRGQRVEATFFKMVELHIAVIESMGAGHRSGREALSERLRGAFDDPNKGGVRLRNVEEYYQRVLGMVRFVEDHQDALDADTCLHVIHCYLSSDEVSFWLRLKKIPHGGTDERRRIAEIVDARLQPRGTRTCSRS